MSTAIYARKSKLSEKGESISNQIEACKKYISERPDKFSGGIKIFKDEGFSGKNVLRPEFQKLLLEIKTNQINAVVCYKLDRVSRSIADFSKLIIELEKYNVNFISIKEQFDTTTPIGRAMMYISSVFAQLERETIAERITDNFTELAATGRYLCCKAPEGFNKKTLEYKDDNGILKKYNILELNTNEAERIKTIFNKYSEYENIQSVVNFLSDNNIRNRNQNNYTKVSVKRILLHPCYMTADTNAYEYLKNLGAKILTEKNNFNGFHGISVLRRINRSSNKEYRDYNEWLISVGYHTGIISSNQWIAVNKSILENIKKRPKKSGAHGLFFGMLYCNSCGNIIKPVSISNNGKYYYKCLSKINDRNSCDSINIRGDTLDRHINNKLNSFLLDKKMIYEELKKNKNNILKFNLKNENKICIIDNKIKENEIIIDKLILKLSETDNKSAIKYIEKKINNLDDEIKKLKSEIEKNKKTKLSYSHIDNIKNILFASVQEKDFKISLRNLYKKIIKKISYDENYIIIYI